MPSAWRIVRAARVNSAFTGEGARVYGGRWNSRGTAVIYVSEHESLAALELFVHLTPLSPDDRYRVVSTRVGGQADRILSRQKSASELERGTADVSNYANRRRMGSRGKVRRPCSAQRAECERDELFVKSQASRFQKNQNQPAGRVSVRFAPLESLTIR